MAMLREREGKAKAAPALVIPKDFSSYASEDDEFFSALSEKSVPERKEALCKTAAMFQTLQFEESSLTAHQQTIVDALKKSFRNDEQEKILAARILALYAITDLDYCATLSTTFEDVLEKLIIIEQNNVSVEAVKCWGTLLFINADDNKTLSALDKCLNLLIESSNPALQAAILETITFNMSAFSSDIIDNEILPRYGPEIEALILSSEEWNVQVAASQCLAVLFSLHREEHDSDEELENCLSVYQIVEYLESFTGMKILSLSDNEQKKVRNQFKESLKVIQEGFCPTEERIIEKHKFTWDNWRQIVQIRWFTDKLQSGLPNHFTGSEFLFDVFGMDKPSDFMQNQKMSKSIKREFYSKNSVSSKERTLQRRRTQRKAL